MNEDKIIGFEDRNLENDLKMFERKWFSEEFIVAREEYVNLDYQENFEKFLKHKNLKLLQEWINFKNSYHSVKNDIKIPNFLTEEDKNNIYGQ